MSYTFLPYIEQQKIKREYRIRVLIVLFFFLSISFVLGVASLFPAYLSAILEEKSHLNEVAAFQKTANAALIAATQKELTTSQTILDKVSSTLETDLFSTTVTSIASIRGSITINSFAVEHVSSSTMSVVLGGVAPTRSELLSFKDRLENLSPNTSVDLPISMLAQDRNISFTIKVTQILP